MREVFWYEPDPEDRNSCPYSVDFKCKPAPASRLSSLESGRLLLTVKLKGKPGGAKVEKIAAKLINKAKERSFSNIRPTSRLKSKILIRATLDQDIKRPNRWTGTLGIPVTWVEGGTETYERAGSWTPRRKGNMFTLEVSYRLHNGGICTTRFGAADVFHWRAARNSKL